MSERVVGVRRSVRRGAAPALLAALLLAAPFAVAQETAPASARESLYRDPEDGAFDLSGWLATQTGVLPVISPITETKRVPGSCFLESCDRCQIPTLHDNPRTANLGSYIRRGEHGYGSRCLPEWLRLDRRPCSRAMRAI